jgi:hypothetical protein
MEQEDLFRALMRFHREVAMPDMGRLVDERVGGEIGGLRNEMLTNFDGVFHRLERVEQEGHMTTAGLRRVEDRLTGVEGRLTHVEHELVEVRVELTELRKERT